MCEEFPKYKDILSNVSFWEDIYGKYTSRQAVLHDRDDLSKVYAIVPLVSRETPGASAINKKLIKLSRYRLKATLEKLSKGKDPITAEENQLAALFPDKNPLLFLAAKDNIRLQLGQKDLFREGVIRSGKYMQDIKTILRDHGLPSTLAYLPHVESSFNPRASSKAGAVGLWQFTRSTGRMYTTIDPYLDARLDPWLSTHAAAELLKKNYELLSSWPLALTAYNYGRPGTIRAVANYKNYVTIFAKHTTGLFKFASRNFYSEFLAAVAVARRLEADPLVIRQQPEATILVPLSSYASVSDICHFFRVSLDDFKRLNPAIQPLVLKDISYIPKSYQIRLPATKRIRLRALQMSIFPYHDKQKSHTIYRVRQGDTLSQIAKRYKISTKTLKKLNKLNKSATIKVGQQLLLPCKKEKKVLATGKKKTKIN